MTSEGWLCGMESCLLGGGCEVGPPGHVLGNKEYR